MKELLRELAKNRIEEIKRLAEKQDEIFDNLVEVLKSDGFLDTKLKEEWLFDAAFNGGDFDFNWEEKINK